MKNLGFTRICREIADVAIYAHYPESFCSENLAIRKVFAFSDSDMRFVSHSQDYFLENVLAETAPLFAGVDISC